MQYVQLNETIHLYFTVTNVDGNGAAADSTDIQVRLAGAAAGDAPVHSPTATLLTHASVPAGCYEVTIPVTVANGYADGETYAVFASVEIDEQEPTRLVGSFQVAPVHAETSNVEDIWTHATRSLTDKEEFELTLAERTAIANRLLDLANSVETGLNIRGALRLIAAATAGKASGMATDTAVLRNALADTKPRITATVDENGNRSAINWDITD